MTSLIDVIFLLLLFFMLSSTFSRYGEIELNGSGAGGLAGDRPVLFLRLSAEDLLLNGRPVAFDALPETLAELMGGEERNVLISLTPEASSQRLVDLLALLRGVDGLAASVLG
ncbi:ExbD/TolR family protein [Tropicimonas sediminicola]|uniref:Outer membrane transport energization protein ExbD n=1 Tax=Tropicimonas sediminicola TaxID=1031541 RepID=A0A239LAX6_9RHOB|nr:outer membrane transport energization protein ExbD [Tropicimonas sediminicola]